VPEQEEASALRQRWEARLAQLEAIRFPHAELYRRAHSLGALPDGADDVFAPPGAEADGALEVGIAGDHRDDNGGAGREREPVRSVSSGV